MRFWLKLPKRVGKYTEAERLFLVTTIDALLKKGLNKKEISEKMNIPYGTVTSLYFRYVGQGIPKNL